MAGALRIDAGRYEAVRDGSIDSATATEDEEHELLNHAGQPVSTTRDSWRLAGRAGAVTATAGAALAALAMLHPSGSFDTRAESLAEVVSESYGFTQCQKKVENQGCSNWQTLKLQDPVKLTSADACNVKCSNTPGCTGYNFQNMQSGTCGGEGIAEGACYLWGMGCEVETNSCWDNYVLSKPTPTAWMINGEGKGCSNWETIKIGNGEVLSSAQECGLLCAKTGTCMGFGYQKGSCGGDEGVSEGACYMWSGACTQVDNVCWDNYKMTSAGTTTTSAPVPAPAGHMWQEPKTEKGCSNWADVLIEERTTEVSAYACGQLCKVTPGCVEYGFQKDGSSRCLKTSLGWKEGACYLYKGNCELIPNMCWDHYSLTTMKEYCPDETEFIETPDGAANPKWTAASKEWEITKEQGVTTKGVWDVLGGYVSYDVDMSGAAAGETAGTGPMLLSALNFPLTNTGVDYVVAECEEDGKCPLVETASLQAGSAYTVYSTKPGGDADCFEKDPCEEAGAGGCRKVTYFQDGTDPAKKAACDGTETDVTIGKIDTSKPFNVNASFNASGAVTVVLTQPPGGTYMETIAPGDIKAGTAPATSETFKKIADASSVNGVVVAFQQTDFKTPEFCQGSDAAKGGTDNSKFKISNLKIKGIKIRGAATECPAVAPPR